MGDITANLSRSEFACKCGCGCNSMDIETVWVVQDVCDHFRCKVDISSGHRCFKHNRTPEVGSNDNSQHPQARAMDCKFNGIAPSEVHLYLCEKYTDKFGFGLYDWGNHIDTRSNGPARWNG